MIPVEFILALQLPLAFTNQSSHLVWRPKDFSVKKLHFFPGPDWIVGKKWPPLDWPSPHLALRLSAVNWKTLVMPQGNMNCHFSNINSNAQLRKWSLVKFYKLTKLMIHHLSTVMTGHFTEIWALTLALKVHFCVLFPDPNQDFSQYTTCLFAHLNPAVNML